MGGGSSKTIVVLDEERHLKNQLGLKVRAVYPNKQKDAEEKRKKKEKEGSSYKAHPKYERAFSLYKKQSKTPEYKAFEKYFRKNLKYYKATNKEGVEESFKKNRRYLVLKNKKAEQEFLNICATYSKMQTICAIDNMTCNNGLNYLIGLYPMPQKISGKNSAKKNSNAKILLLQWTDTCTYSEEEVFAKARVDAALQLDGDTCTKLYSWQCIKDEYVVHLYFIVTFAYV